MRLIDANALLDKQESLYMKGHVLFHGVTAYAIENAPAIDPETLPIVQRLKAELAEFKAERDALLKELSGECGVCSHYDDCIKNHYSCCDGSNWEYCGPKKEE